MKLFQISLSLGAILVLASTSTLAEPTHSGSGLVDGDLRAVWQLTDRDGVAWLRKAAEQGNADAQFDLGVMYDNGQGVPQDDKEAVVWLRKVAEQGPADAQYRLGLMYLIG
jgi:TPR repeat protein